MRPLFVFPVILALLSVPLPAQTAPTPPAGTLEGVTIGEPMANLRHTLGDPIQVNAAGNAVIWRYLTHGGGVYLDVLVRNNVAQSVTVLSRLRGVQYAAPSGVAFGMGVRSGKSSTGRTLPRVDEPSLGSLKGLGAGTKAVFSLERSFDGTSSRQ